MQTRGLSLYRRGIVLYTFVVSVATYLAWRSEAATNRVSTTVMVVGIVTLSTLTLGSLWRWLVVPLWRLHLALVEFITDWTGLPAHAGHPRRIGVLEQTVLSQAEVLVAREEIASLRATINGFINAWGRDTTLQYQGRGMVATDLVAQQAIVREALSVQQAVIRDALAVQQEVIRAALSSQESVVREALAVQQEVVKDDLTERAATIKADLSIVS